MVGERQITRTAFILLKKVHQRVNPLRPETERLKLPAVTASIFVKHSSSVSAFTPRSVSIEGISTPQISQQHLHQKIFRTRLFDRNRDLPGEIFRELRKENWAFNSAGDSGF